MIGDNRRFVTARARALRRPGGTAGLRASSRGPSAGAMPLVSVILPTRDRPALLPRAIESVLRQTHAELEVVIVDNNQSTPPVRETGSGRNWLRDGRVVVVECRHATNASIARNAGLGVARAEWITYLDDDDAFQPGKVAAQLARAGETGCPFVLCGYTVVLPRRRRVRQTHATAFQGDALLLDANWGTPMLFHRRDPGARFPEQLGAGHDTMFALEYLKRHDLRMVPNCAQSLVEVYPQAGAARVHANGEEIWRSFEAVRASMGDRFSPAAWRGYLAMGRLFRAQFGYGSIGHFAGCAANALIARGPSAWRLVLNATARRTGWFKDWVVS